MNTDNRELNEKMWDFGYYTCYECKKKTNIGTEVEGIYYCLYDAYFARRYFS